MSVACVHCVKPRKSKVLESRTVKTKVSFRGEMVTTSTIRRRRQCPDCNFRWITIESVIPSSHGIDRGAFGEHIPQRRSQRRPTKETKHESRSVP